MPTPHQVSPLTTAHKVVLLIGTNGFIGNHVLQALQEHTGLLVRTMVRNQISDLPAERQSIGDLGDTESIHRALDGVDIVINAASYVGSDRARARMTNATGVQNLVNVWSSAKASHLIHVSTTAVYGSGPHRGASPADLSYAPESFASGTRAVGDASVLAAGGTVLRPSLVYGVGDRWVVPGLARMFTALGANIDEGGALLSAIDASQLGRLVAALVSSDPPQGAFHASAPKPITLNELLQLVRAAGHPLQTERSVSLDVALERLVPLKFTEHQIRMIGQDHWYDSAEVWGLPDAQTITAV
ncbi:NAD-dependent epimerase/dehydratase family protein [Pseudarthrobacter sp. 1G09]|uniref:NAD-dependent epimerase/dehydratase family protein n=1 Tax=Pseudarthrobacter sp. 1G09 TaxID=3416178 RepID=UPI003CFB2095